MHIQSSITSISWIPSEAISGVTRLPFDLKVGHYDDPPPDRIDRTRLTELRDADVFRFANHLSGSMEVDDGRVTRFQQGGSGLLNNTHMRIGGFGLTFQAHAFPDLRPAPVVTSTSVTFSQTAGGRPGMPAPRLVQRLGRLALVAPTVWTTLRLTLHADGHTEAELAGGTPFPRHWVYGHDGQLVQKTATISFDEWYERPPGATGTPWGDENSPVFVTMAETSLEREMSRTLMREGGPSIRSLEPGEELIRQGEPFDGLFVVLDGMLSVDVDGRDVGEVGPGAVIGERAALERGVRTATLRATTPVKVAVVGADAVSEGALRELTGGHRREDD